MLSDRLDTAVARGVLGAGTAHRIALAARLRSTLPSSSLGPPRVLSGEEMARELGITRAAVHKHMEHLRALGFAVVPVSGSGYRLDRPFTDLVAAEAVLPYLMDEADPAQAWVSGLPYRYIASCQSTNRELKKDAASSPSGTLVIADEQTGGRGRLGRTWVSRPGEDLTFSVLLRPALGPAQAHLLSLAAALAVAEVLEDIQGLRERVGIKWPNDVLLGGEKVCGILVEGSMDPDRLEWAVAGIGLNVNSDPAALLGALPPETREEWSGKPRPTSLRVGVGHALPRSPLLAALLARLTVCWAHLEPGALLDGLRRRDVLGGRMVEVLSGPPQNALIAAGKVLGIGPEGQLLLRDRAGDQVAVFAGDVTVRHTEGPTAMGGAPAGSAGQPVP